MKFSAFILSIQLLLNTAYADQVFHSSGSNNQLIELYTSQGCSSCPPAQRWISSYKQDKSLWVNVFPVVFHVDYWNYLGWSDPFSQAAFSIRQRSYHSVNSISSVYTPGFVVNGKEWRRWYLNNSKPEIFNTIGSLHARLKDGTLTVGYQQRRPAVLNVAILINSHTTDVTHGENSGRSLKEDFTVMDFYTQSSANGEWSVKIKPDSLISTENKAIVIWVSDKDTLQPLQVTGGKLY